MQSSEDRILDGRVILNQPLQGYRAAIDPVLLAASVPVKPKDRALDLGCGVGAAMLCLVARGNGVHVDGLEIQPELAQLARQNIEANGFADRVRVFDGDLLAPPEFLVPGGYDHVFANPPYITEDRGHPPSNACKCTAHVEGQAALKDWVQTALKFCRHKGTVSFIYRADRLAEVLTALGRQAGAIEIIPLWPKADDPASRIIVRARKGLKTPLILTSGLVLHTADGNYSEAADRVLRGEASL